MGDLLFPAKSPPFTNQAGDNINSPTEGETNGDDSQIKGTLLCLSLAEWKPGHLTFFSPRERG